jgi:hypothetical protein
MFVKDLETNRDVWSVTLPVVIAKVHIAEGIIVASDPEGKVVWSSPSPSGPNAGAPYILRVTDSGALLLMDARNAVIFQTPRSQPLVVPNQEAVPMATAMRAPEAAAGAVVAAVDPQVTGPAFMRPMGPHGLPAIFSVPE